MIYAHRVNTSKKLKKLNPNLGIEIDVRYRDGNLVLMHDLTPEGERLKNFMENYRHKSIIVNVKDDLIEDKVEELFSDMMIKDYMFLDSLPATLIRRSIDKKKNNMIRISEYEDLNIKLVKMNPPKGIWVDAFHDIWYNAKFLQNLHEDTGSEIILVSPELHDPHRTSELDLLISENLESIEIPISVCTKFPERYWDLKCLT